MNRLIVKLWKDEEGQDLTEYALLLALISVFMVTTIQGLATAIQTAINSATTNLT